MCDSCGCHISPDTDQSTTRASKHDNSKIVDVHKSLLEANRRQAEKNRRHIEAMGAVAINMISSPGSGKTTLLEATIDRLGDRLRIGVIEGDIETERDAERIRKKGIPVVQLTTGGACHLDAPLVHKGLHELEALAHEGSGPAFDLIFIENVGNLVCPATFDLGEHRRMVLLSVPEGSDKPAKYPAVFSTADLFLITKTDLIKHFDFSMKEAVSEAKRIKPSLESMKISSKTGDGLDEWCEYLESLCIQY